jgi:hypothetical protein
MHANAGSAGGTFHISGAREMTKPSLFACGCLAAIAVGVPTHAQTTYEQVNGVTYQVTRTPQSIPVTTYQTQQSKSYQPQTTTQYQAYPQTTVAPVTQYQWVSRYRNWWNPFGRPYWTTELEPVTRWQAQQSTVHVPVSKTEWVEHTHTAQVPVTTYRTEIAESRVPVSVSPLGPTGQTSVATRPVDFGGQRLDGDRGGESYRR